MNGPTSGRSALKQSFSFIYSSQTVQDIPTSSIFTETEPVSVTERDSVTLRSATDFSVSQLSQRSATTISEISQQYSQPINHRAIEIVAPPPLARPLGTPGTAINSATSFDGAAVNREVSCYISH